MNPMWPLAQIPVIGIIINIMINILYLIQGAKERKKVNILLVKS